MTFLNSLRGTPRAEVDVAIVGGGPAGLAAALFLEHFAPDIARRTVVLERATYPREKICAGAVGERALALLDSISARPAVPHVELRGISVTTEFGRSMTRERDSVGWVVRRAEFDHALARIAMKRGVAVEQGCSVTAVRTPRSGPVEIDVEGGPTIVAKAVVGADGVRSIVRRSLGWSRGEIVAQVVEIDTETLPSDVPSDILHFDLTEPGLRGYAWDFPTPIEDRVRISRGVYDLGPKKEDPSARLDRRTASALKLGKKRRYSERGVSLDEPFSKGRVILAGEAAGIDPVLGEGIAQAIFYGQKAARYLVKNLNRPGDFEDYTSFVLSGRLGMDLRGRARALPLIYGTTRGIAERFVARSNGLAHAGLHYFAGRHVSRLDLARAGLDLAVSVTQALRS